MPGSESDHGLKGEGFLRVSSFDNALADTINGLHKPKMIWWKRSRPSLSAVELATLRWVEWFDNRRMLGLVGHIRPPTPEAIYYAARETLNMVA